MEELTEYDPAEFEENIYQQWLDKDVFVADEETDDETFSMVIPPPNVTGTLHMGHALNCTLQDVLARWRKMQGYEVLWLPGTDHAGIATQNVVERQLREEGTDRTELGREKFLERVWDWREEYGDQIIHQLEQLGVSCDWSRERFTLDEGLSRAVTEVFNQLHEDGLIYRGDYIVNWCPRCQTALSDVEVEHQTVNGHWYHMKYPLVDEDDYLHIATTRPETMLGDTAVAFHPGDERYEGLEGEKVLLPLVEREIPVLADNRVDPDFGSGLVKITPAHDDLDFRIGKDHDLPVINMLNEDGTYNDNGGQRFDGLDRYEVREKVVEELREADLMLEIEDYSHEVGHCYRCDTAIEPYISQQWFVSMEPLAEPAIESVKEDQIEFHPERWEKTYFEWMENIRDWCISRQIWWGHRIPVWYGPDEEYFVARDEEEAREKAREHYGEEVELTRETDVLDTWFSSALWPFSTLGWPEDTTDLEAFYPTDVLSTGFDIIYFWVARMIMMGHYCMGEKPFSDVYIHALIRTEDGEKMSKSLGNVIDPLDMIDDFGCDPLRFTLCALAAQGRDIRLSRDRIKGFRNFANKVWNAARYAQFALEEPEADYLREPIQTENCSDLEKWLLSRFQLCLKTATKALENFNFDRYADHIYQFFWHEFCDWYIEISKLRLEETTGAEKRETEKVLYRVLLESLKALHPAMPYLTEHIYQIFQPEGGLIAESGWPAPPESWSDREAVEVVEALQEIVRAGRHLKKEFNVQQSEGVELLLAPESVLASDLEKLSDYVESLAGLENFSLASEEDKPEMSATEVLEFGTAWIPLEGLIDVEKEKQRIQKDRAERVERCRELEGRLDNPQFVENAPEEVVEESRTELSQINDEIERLDQTLEMLEAG